MLAVVFFILLLLWLLFVVFLQPFYEQQRYNSVNRSAEEITNILNKDLDKETLENELEDLAFQEDICMEIDIKSTGFPLIIVDTLGSECLIHGRHPFPEVINFINQFAAGDSEQELRRVEDRRVNVNSILLLRRIEVSGEEAILIINTPLRIVEGTTKVILTLLFWVTLALIIMASVIGFWAALSISRPIRTISNTVQRYAKGDFSARIKIKNKDELGELAANFNKMATELGRVEETRRDMIASVSHELRTPLTMIKGYAETILDISGEDKKKREKHLQVILDECNRLEYMVNDMLDLAQLQKGQKTMNLQPFDIGVSIKNVIEHYVVLQEEQGFKIDCHGEDGLMVLGDEIRLKQVFYNLINNAVNHIGEDGLIIVNLFRRGDRCRIEVSDHGSGIEAEHLPLIWDRYYSVNKSGKRGRTGSGLGLSIVKEILTLHQADFGVKSTVGEGTTFWLELKLDEARRLEP